MHDVLRSWTEMFLFRWADGLVLISASVYVTQGEIAVLQWYRHSTLSSGSFKMGWLATEA